MIPAPGTSSIAGDGCDAINSKASRSAPCACSAVWSGRPPSSTTSSRIGNWNKFLTGKLQSLCEHCHNADKRMAEQGKPRVTIGEDGWPM